MGITAGGHECWQYGKIELHFDKDELIMIFSDYIHELDGGESIKLNKWILSNPGFLTLRFVIEQLNLEKIDFVKMTDKFNSIRLCLSESKVDLIFNGEDENGEIIVDPNLYRLAAISLMRR